MITVITHDYAFDYGHKPLSMAVITLITANPRVYAREKI